MIMILEFPMSCRPTIEYSGINLVNVFAELICHHTARLARSGLRRAGLAMRQSRQRPRGLAVSLRAGFDNNMQITASVNSAPWLIRRAFRGASPPRREWLWYPYM
jgi:hypothetical protein